MVYIIVYLLVGLVLVVVKSPVRKEVDEEIQKIKIQAITNNSSTPSYKLLLFRIILSAILIFVYPAWLIRWLKQQWALRKTVQAAYVPRRESHITWLGNAITVEEAEGKHMVEMSGNDVPFGYQNMAWKRLLGQMKKGDSLYEFRSPDDSWEMLAGREGVALVRDGEVIDDIVTLMN
jgi:hypothetical protein